MKVNEKSGIMKSRHLPAAYAAGLWVYPEASSGQRRAWGRGTSGMAEQRPAPGNAHTQDRRLQKNQCAEVHGRKR